jgi:putative protease
MLLTKKSVELLAPVGSWEVLEAAVNAGADAVYLGGKRFNMRLHRTDANFDDQTLAKAIEYAHQHQVRLYVTVNNLINDHEMDGLRSYLTLLEQLQPDALIVQDMALLELAKEMKLTVPLHASVMMNTHNEHAVRLLQEYGISRVVVNREMSLSQLSLLKERTGIEVEYFIHGDMCIAHSGQCIHSGVVFGQSSNRGRCLKPCRWPYQLVDEVTSEPLAQNDPGPYKLAMKDMCMYTHLPELIQAGVCSFKIEGRMRTADFIRRIVTLYRRAIDRYIADPAGYAFDPEDWSEMYRSRSRDFTTCYALGNPGAGSVGYSGKTEPRFFSQAVREAGLEPPAFLRPTAAAAAKANQAPVLAVRVADLASLTLACRQGADIVYVGGEAFMPSNPWTLSQISQAVEKAAEYQAKVVVATPRITMERECGELEQLFTHLNSLPIYAVMVSNPGALKLARQYSRHAVHADYSFNIFNHLTTRWLKEQGVTSGTLSLESTFEQTVALSTNSLLPLELIIHGPLEAMVSDHCIPSAVLGRNDVRYLAEFANRQYALLDTAGQKHPLKIDQYGRNHIFFAKDLCLLPVLQALTPINHFRIEGQHYRSELVEMLTKTYRQELNKLFQDPHAYRSNTDLLEKIKGLSPRELGLAAFRYRNSR